jgi:hypothetical protein
MIILHYYVVNGLPHPDHILADTFPHIQMKLAPGSRPEYPGCSGTGEHVSNPCQKDISPYIADVAAL